MASKENREEIEALERGYAKYSAEQRTVVAAEELTELCRRIDGLGSNVEPIVTTGLHKMTLGELMYTMRKFIATLQGSSFGFKVDYLEAIRTAVTNQKETNHIVRSTMTAIKTMKLKTEEERAAELANGGRPEMPIHGVIPAIDAAVLRMTSFLSEQLTTLDARASTRLKDLSSNLGTALSAGLCSSIEHHTEGMAEQVGQAVNGDMNARIIALNGEIRAFTYKIEAAVTATRLERGQLSATIERMKTDEA